MQTQTPLTRCRHDVTGAIAPLPKRGWRLASNPPGRGRFSALRSLSPALQRRATQRAGARHPTRRSEGASAPGGAAGGRAWHPTRRSEDASAPFVRSARRFSAGRHSGRAPGIQPAGARALQRPSFAQPGASASGDTADGRPASNPPGRGRFSAGRRSGRAPGIQAGGRSASNPPERGRFSAGRHSGTARISSWVQA